MSSAGDEDLVAIRNQIHRMSQYGAVDGKEISDPTGSLVFEQTITTGKVVAVKVRAPRGEVETSQTEDGGFKILEHPPTYVVERTEAEMSKQFPEEHCPPSSCSAGRLSVQRMTL